MRLVDEAPAGGRWLHEIKYDGYRMHARIDGRDIRLLTRTGLDWSHPALWLMMLRCGADKPATTLLLGRQRSKRDGVSDEAEAAVAGPECVVESKPVLLIVEDEILVLTVAVEIAEEAGFSVLQAADADEAIRILQGRADIRVVLTDIDMPGSMDGLELAQAIRHRWPPIEVVLTSGKMRPAADELPERSHFLPKPYDFSELIGLLRKISR